MEKKKIVYCIALIIIFCSIILTDRASALVVQSNGLSNMQAFNFNFNFSNPGARSNGMGGAFIAVADDATAAYTNPAGLVVLTRPEVAAEFKSTTTITPVYFQSGLTPPLIVEQADAKNTTSDVSFLSFSYPLEKANVTLYRHQMVNSSFDVQYITNYLNGNQTPTHIVTELDLVTYGVSAAYKISDKFSLGLSVGFDDFSIDRLTTSGNSLGPSTSSNSFGGSDRSEHFILSLLWSPLERFNIGLIYRYGPEFKYRTTFELTSNGTVSGIYQLEDKFKVPDVYGAGVSYRFPFGLTLAADVNYIMYSQIMKDVTYEDGTRLKVFTAPGISYYTAIDDYKLKDAYEAHVGLEYVLTIKEIPLAFRGGYCYRQAHRVYYEANESILNILAISPGSLNPAELMPKGDDEHLGSLGFGIVLGKNFQVDVAGTYGTFTREYIASFVLRF